MSRQKNIFLKPVELRPQYAEAFRCIGSACEDTCCSGWTINVDRGSYEKYQAITDGPFRILIEEGIAPNPDAVGDGDYARVRLNPQGACSFLTSEQTCSIHKDLGESYLSNTCATYPRVPNRIGGSRETALTLSCPEAARLTLLDRELVSVKKFSVTGPSRYRDFLESEPPAVGGGQAAVRYLWQVRHFIVLLLKDGMYELWERLFLLGMLCRRMDALVSQDEVARIPHLLKEYAEIIAGGRLREPLARIEARPQLQLGVVLQLVGGCARSRLVNCVKDFCRGIGHTPERTVAELAGRYVEAQAQWFRPWAQAHPYVLENYLLNYLFARLFPFGLPGPEQGKHIYREYVQICFHYGLIKGLLTGIAGHYRAEFDTRHALTLIQAFTRAVEHSSIQLGQITSFFTDRGLDNTDGVTILLRDDGGIPV